MQKIIIALSLMTLFASGAVLANGKTNKAHLKMTGKDKAKINCVYCHNTAGIPKKKGQDVEKFYKTAYCMGKGCHAVNK